MELNLIRRRSTTSDYTDGASRIKIMNDVEIEHESARLCKIEEQRKSSTESSTEGVGARHFHLLPIHNTNDPR